jgi:chemotaxis protein methyltransferase CheR
MLQDDAMNVNAMQNSMVMPKTMSNAEFRRLSEFVFDLCGIKISPVKKVMLEGRLQKRLKSLGIGSYGEYCDYLFNAPDRENEFARMIDCVTTNKTDFFREPIHFRFLTDTLLPEFANAAGDNAKKMTIWSAGCSSGEEPYTLAMVLSDFASQCPGFQFSIFATDISNKVLEKARLGIYDEELVACVPLSMKQKYLLRGKNRQKRLARIAPAIRTLVQFRRVNLMDDRIMPQESLDVIFCRNVIIYFNRETQFKLIEKLCSYLKTGGYLFLGHSETTQGFTLPLTRVTSTIYRKGA